MITIGVTIGKFNIPHMGHLRMIEFAAKQVDQLFVILCFREDQTVSGLERYSILEQDTPSNVSILMTVDNLPAVSEPWAERTMSVLDSIGISNVDVAFSSEPWGNEWAGFMDAHHISYNQQRDITPTSGTEIRNDIIKHWDMLMPTAKSMLGKRVTVVGAESTGKTTLTKMLAEWYFTTWAPEYGRLYTDGMPLHNTTWSTKDFEIIAEAQSALGLNMARHCRNGVTFSDTDSMCTAAWCNRYLNEISKHINTKPPTDLYVICSPNIPWVQDGTRESLEFRDMMHESIVAGVEESGVEYIHVLGDPDARVQQVVDHLHKHLLIFPQYN